MSVHIEDKEAISIRVGEHTLFGIPRLEQPFSESPITSAYADEYIINGQVPNGSAKYIENTYPETTEEYPKGVSDAEELFAALADMEASYATDKIPRTVYMKNNITINGSDNYTPYLSAEELTIPTYCVFDGCGYTLTISGSWTKENNTSIFWGGFVGSCEGMIKNLNVYSTANLINTNSNEYNYGKKAGIGLLVGTPHWGLIDNCTITWAGNGVFWKRKMSGYAKAFLGSVCGLMQAAYIKNTTVILNNCLTLTTPGQTGPSKNWDAILGGMVGRNENKNSGDNRSQLINCTIIGTGGLAPNDETEMGLFNWHDNITSGNGYHATGCFIGRADANIDCINLKIGGTFNFKTIGKARSYMGLIAGSHNGNSNQPRDLSHIFYSTNPLCVMNRFGHLDDGRYVCGDTATITDKPCYYGYDGSDYCWGFDQAGIDTLWIGDIETINPRQLSTESDIKGCFINKINIDKSSTITTYDIGKYITAIELKNNNNKMLVAKIPLSEVVLETAVTGKSGTIINESNYGYYGYVSKQVGDTANTYKLYYNNGLYLNYNLDSKYINRVGIYNIYSIETIDNIPYHITKNTTTNYYNLEG